MIVPVGNGGRPRRRAAAGRDDDGGAVADEPRRTTPAGRTPRWRRSRRRPRPVAPAVHRLRDRRHRARRRCSGIREVINEPVIQLDDVRGSERRRACPRRRRCWRATRPSDTTYCIEVTITAIDRDGLSLETVVAEPTTGDGDAAARPQRQLRRPVRGADRAARSTRSSTATTPSSPTAGAVLTERADRALTGGCLACLARRVYSSTGESPNRGRIQ